MEPKYKPLYDRVPDTQYRDSLKRILKEGELTQNPFQTRGTRTLLTLNPMVFLLSNGFPVITERKIGFWRKSIAELLAFIHGVRDARILAEIWGVNWWKEQWATSEKCAQFGLEPHDLGWGSYGVAFHDFPTMEGGSFNQFYHLVEQIRWRPSLRTHVVSPWIPQYCLQHDGRQRKVVVAPCHGWIQVTIIDDKLTLRMDQRSADFPIGVPSNIIQYAALTMMIAHVTGYEPYMYIHSTHDSQIYEDQVDHVGLMLERETRVFPSLHFTKNGQDITDLFHFRPEHFELRDYNPHPTILGIPVTT
ncbi:MAG: thymidylate synthase [Thermoplasmatota archaeon]